MLRDHRRVHSSTGHGPLSGVRIVDLTTVVMGPLATRILGDMGADVIKVEGPAYDLMRDLEPKRHDAMSGFTLNLNRNKRSVVLDLKEAGGRAAMLELVATADAFVTNVRPAALERLGLGPDVLIDARPDLVHCSAVGFGSEGPNAGRAAYDDVIQAASGTASMFALTGGDPALVPSIVADKICALHIAYAVSAALHRRAVTGEGDRIEVPMAEVMAAFNLVEHINGHAFEPPIGDFSYGRVTTASRRPRRSADGWFVVLPYSDANWHDFFTAAGRPDLAADPLFATLASRVDNVEALNAAVEELGITRTTAEWMRLCDEISIACSPVVELEHVAEDPHFAAVGLIAIDEHPTEGPYRVVRDPAAFASRTDGEVRRHAPNVGEHTDEVLRELRSHATRSGDES